MTYYESIQNNIKNKIGRRNIYEGNFINDNHIKYNNALWVEFS